MELPQRYTRICLRPRITLETYILDKEECASLERLIDCVKSYPQKGDEIYT
jgi:hypothetical protein